LGCVSGRTKMGSTSIMLNIQATCTQQGVPLKNSYDLSNDHQTILNEFV